MGLSEAPIQVNTRFLGHEQTGVQRYATEILKRLGSRIQSFRPKRVSGAGIPGHLWEQFILPAQLDHRLFWNPTCPGPVAVSNQVITVHDLSVIDHPEWFDWKYAWWNRLLIPLCIRRARHVIAVSTYTKQKICSRYDVNEQEVSVIYNGVDARFKPAPERDVAAMRARLGVPAGPYVLSLSAIEPRKNLHRLVQIWGSLQSELEEVPTLVLAGGAGRPTIFHDYSLDETSPNVHFPGYVDEEWLPALYTGAKAFVYPSLYEGFGLPVLEAMACGTAVLTSATTSLPEVAGDAALLADPHSTRDLKEKLHELITNHRLRSTLEGRAQKQASRFNWDATAQQTWDVLSWYLKGKD